ncbi:hypothetical protein CR513_57482, partial [Mucuna pruriens]
MLGRLHVILSHVTLEEVHQVVMASFQAEDDAILAQEVLHHIHKTQEKEGLAAIKINLEKAYDRVNRNFPKSLLEFGFVVGIEFLKEVQ